MKLGILSVAFGPVGYKELAVKTAEMGFASTHFQCKHITDVDIRRPGKLSTGLGNEIAEAFARQGVKIPALGCYMNLIDRDAERRLQSIRMIKEHLRFARDFGASMVTTETGTANLQSQWEHHPDNQNEQNWALLRSVLEELAEEAEKWGVSLGLDGYFNNVLNTPERMENMLEQVASTQLGIVMDPCNFIPPQQAARADEIMTEAFERLGERILIAHAKDFALAAEGLYASPEPAAGTGLLNYPLYFSLLSRSKPHCTLCLEHLKGHQMPNSIARLQEAWLAASAAQSAQAEQSEGGPAQ
jgi:sugar phosphate isomerase/epimerase